MFEEVTIGECRLILGDCREVLPLLPPVDLVLTDPPFGVGNFVQVTGNVRGKIVTWNESAPSAEVFEEIKRLGKHQIIWGANYFNCFDADGGAIVWIKNQPMPNFSKAEVASCSFWKKTELIELTWTNFVNSKESDHPCERPVLLYEACLKFAPKTTSTVADPFMGSGTTGVACARMGLQFVGIERERKYFDIACERIYNAYRQNTLFGQDENVQEVPASQTAIEFQQE
jgi:DNA modification methylase